MNENQVNRLTIQRQFNVMGQEKGKLLDKTQLGIYDNANWFDHR